MPAIAEAGYYCVAMDQRGYGRTTGWANVPFHEVALEEYTVTNLIRDHVCLVYKLGYKEVACIIGHDFGGVSSAMGPLLRPEIFKSGIQMSHPHHAIPTPPFGNEQPKEKVDIQAELAKLDPPRKHYKWYNVTPEAASDWYDAEQGLETYLRGYFHLKSADWKYNKPHPLKEWSAKELEQLPEYYVLRREDTFPQSVARNMNGEDYSKTERWLTPEDFAVYVAEWKRIGFQGALNWYRAQTASTPQAAKDLLLFAGRRIDVPVMFLSGKQDWGNYQQPGAFESYEDDAVVKDGCCKGVTLVDGAGHWIAQEQPERVIEEVLKFLKNL